MVYISTGFINGLIGMNISDNYVGILVFQYFFSYNGFILQLQTTINVIL